MKFLKESCENIIKVQKNKEMPYIYDIDLSLCNGEILNRFQWLECHIVLYPYSRKITSHQFEFTPFEEYVSDILSRQKSAYVKIKNHVANVFGLLLGFLLITIFLIFKPSDLFSIEPIVSIFGAYFVGKELWDDIEEALMGITKNWKIRYVERYYIYKLEKMTTLSLYSYHAKKKRYGKSAILPEKMDFLQKRNSETIRMLFNLKDLKKLDSDTAHILSIRMNPNLIEALEKDGYMLGVKLSFNRRFLGFTRCREVFQSLESNSKGCLDHLGNWFDDTVFYRNTLMMGRLKFFINKGILKDKNLIDAFGDQGDF